MIANYVSPVILSQFASKQQIMKTIKIITMIINENLTNYSTDRTLKGFFHKLFRYFDKTLQKRHLAANCISNT